MVIWLRVASGTDKEELDKFKQQEPKMKGKWKVLRGPAAGHYRGIKAKSKKQGVPRGTPRIRARIKYLSQDFEAKGEEQIKQDPELEKAGADPEGNGQEIMPWWYRFIDLW